MTTSGLPEPILKTEIDAVRNSLQHLERSNAELRKAIEENGPDPDFRQAINENIVVIAKRRARLEALEEELRKMTGGDVTSGVATAASQPPGPRPTASPAQGHQPTQHQNSMAASAAPTGPAPTQGQGDTSGDGGTSGGGGAQSATEMEVDGGAGSSGAGSEGAAAATESGAAGSGQGVTAAGEPAGGGEAANDGVWL